MKILLVGSGGREHALAWKLAQSERVTQVYVAPGNPGTAAEAKVTNVALDVQDIAGLCDFAMRQGIDFTLVGPELPLQLGIVDYFKQRQQRCLGPSRLAAELETSKKFCKDFLKRHAIPTAAYASFSDERAALQYLDACNYPQVIKADGLAAGKGVVIVQNKQEALAALPVLFAINHCVIIEEFLIGEEASFIVLTDGEQVVALASAQDHKRRDAGDVGPNTGGMGAYSPAPVLTDACAERVLQQIIVPTLRGMQQEGRPYQGFLYAGLMIDALGQAKVLEYNCRLGDPETQAILPRMQSDFAQLCLACFDQQLAECPVVWSGQSSVCVVLAAAGYPDSYPRGEIISGLDAPRPSHQWIFHAGTAAAGDAIVTAGGRVLNVCSLGTHLQEAQQQAYQLVQQIKWQHQYYRADIAYKGIAHQQQLIDC